MKFTKYINDRLVTDDEIDGYVVTNKNLIDAYTLISHRIERERVIETKDVMGQ